MGVVFRAEDPLLKRQVALKAMLPALAASGTAKQRFFREAQAAAALKHAHVVTIHQVGEDRGAPFLAMEYLEGEPLDRRLQRLGTLPVPEVLRIGREIAEGLAAAHDKGLVHRDIKPANVWLEGKEGHVKILDFGLARAARGDARLTQLGALIGTPAYMAPEQADGRDVDHRCDLFSLGVVLYRACTGRMPFQGKDTVSTIVAVATETPPVPHDVNPQVPRGLSALVMHLLAKGRDDRPDTAAAVAGKLAALEMGKGTDHAPDEGSRKHGRPAARRQASAAGRPFANLGGRASAPAKTQRVWPWLVPTLVGAAVLLLGLGLGFIFFRGPAPSTVQSRQVAQEKANGGQAKNSGDAGRVLPGPSQKGATQKDQSPPADKKDRSPPADKVGVLGTSFKNSLGMEFVLIPKGKSWLAGEPGNPGPVHVEVTHDFWLGKYEVTQGEWQAVMGNNPSWFSRDGLGKRQVRAFKDDDLKHFPVECVSWEDAQEFLRKLNARESEAGWVYRLPTELEWEYACRGGPLDNRADSAYNYYFSEPLNNLGPDDANVHHSQGKVLQRTCKVGSYRPNVLGLCDMHGNVWEWCADEYKVDDGSSRRFVKGGSWHYSNGDARAAGHGAYPPSDRLNEVGLRVARVAVGKQAVLILPPATK
jgi:formylglycine-generating enzyme required for sulfatase activity